MWHIQRPTYSDGFLPKGFTALGARSRPQGLGLFWNGNLQKVRRFRRRTFDARRVYAQLSFFLKNAMPVNATADCESSIPELFVCFCKEV